MFKIELPPHSMMALIYECYKSDDPSEFLKSMLDPYYISNQQLTYITTEIRWYYARKITHPLTYFVHLIEDLSKPNFQTAEKTKQQFILASTMICHLWYEFKRNDEIYLPRNVACFSPFESPNQPVSYVWLNVDQNMSLDLVFGNYKSPLRVRVERECFIGKLFPYEVEFYNDCRTNDLIDLSINISTSLFGPKDSRNNVRLNSTFQVPTTANKNNFVVLITEGELMRFINCYCVSPSTHQLWCYPVLIHALI